MTPLHIAVEKGHAEIVGLLLQNPKLDINLFCKCSQINSRSKETALHIAVEKEDLQIIQLLLMNSKINVNLSSKMEKGRSTSVNDEVPLHVAVRNKSIDIVKLLLQNAYIDINYPMISTFVSTESDFLSISRHESKRERTALHLAIENNDIEIVKLLLSNDKVDVNSCIKFTSFGSEKNENINYSCAIKQETPALYFAVDENCIEIVRLLLKNEKIDVNLPSVNKIDSSDTKFSKYEEIAPLHVAVKNKRIEIIRYLIENEKINVNLPLKSSNESESDKTPLHLAVIAGHLEIIKMLIQNKNIDLNAYDFYSKKPIDYSQNTEINELFAD